MQSPQVFLSDAAFLALAVEAREYADRETGGIFLGAIQGDRWYVLEVVDPGYGRIVRRASYFEYDQEYVTHLANVRSRLYRNGLGLLGLWHRHPGSFDQFSQTDDGTNQLFAEGRPEGALSALVNFDPDFRLTLYHVSLPLAYRRVDRIHIGDAHIPREIRAFKNPRQVLQSRADGSNGGGLWNAMKRNVLPRAAAPDGPPPADEAVFDMLEREQAAWLDHQSEYEYDLRFQDGGINLFLRRAKGGLRSGEVIHCRLTRENGRGVCFINHCKQTYFPGILREYAIDRMGRYRRNRTIPAAIRHPSL